MGVDSTPLLPWSSCEVQLLLNCSQSRQRRKTRPLIRKCPIEEERYEQSETLAKDTKSRQRRASSRKEVLPYSHPTPLSITETTWILKLLSVTKVESPGVTKLCLPPFVSRNHLFTQEQTKLLLPWHKLSHCQMLGGDLLSTLQRQERSWAAKYPQLAQPCTQPTHD